MHIPYTKDGKIYSNNLGYLKYVIPLLFNEQFENQNNLQDITLLTILFKIYCLIKDGLVEEPTDYNYLNQVLTSPIRHFKTKLPVMKVDEEIDIDMDTCLESVRLELDIFYFQHGLTITVDLLTEEYTQEVNNLLSLYCRIQQKANITKDEVELLTGCSIGGV